MANEDLLGKRLRCIVCTKPLTEDQEKLRSVACSKECKDQHNRMKRTRVDNRSCRYCHKASTPNQRKAFSRFRKWERENPALAYPIQAALIQAAGMPLEDFGRAIAQAVKVDVDFTSEYPEHRWEAIKELPTGEAMPAELGRALAILAKHKGEADHGDA